MKIHSIKVWKKDLGNKKPYTIAYKTVDEVLNVFVQLTLEDGTTGLGSANPSKYVVGEDVEECFNALSPENLTFLEGQDIREFNRLLALLPERFPHSTGARTAIDIALHDAFSKFIKVPLVKFLGEKHKSLPTSVTIGIKDVRDTLEEAHEFVEQGFFVLKVKLGRDIIEDIERIEKLRKTFRDKIVIRVDANQGYSWGDCISLYERIDGYNVELIEQPLPANAIDELRSLPRKIREIIALDESLLTAKDALMLAQHPLAARIFNIKLMKCGGIFEAKRIAEIASLAGIDLFWGCNDESIVSISAALHAAFSCANTKYLDLDGSLDLLQDVVSGGFEIKNGMMRCLDRPGLGVQ
jgi:L-alanine-DL-glutamate epimerase-like enolase superfamily enzyme